MDGVQRREGGWLGAMGGKVPEVRVLSPTAVFNGRRRGLSSSDSQAAVEEFSSSSDMDDADDVDDDWDDLCTTEGEEEDLTDIDM